jgi:hypothetical protein
MKKDTYLHCKSQARTNQPRASARQPASLGLDSLADHESRRIRTQPPRGVRLAPASHSSIDRAHQDDDNLTGEEVCQDILERLPVYLQLILTARSQYLLIYYIHIY